MNREKDFGAEQEQKYMGCFQSTFSASVAALREAGIELVTSGTEKGTKYLLQRMRAFQKGQE